MTHEITEVIEQHGKAVTEFKQKIEGDYRSLNDRIDQLEEKSVKLNTPKRAKVGSAAAIVKSFTASEQFQMLAKGAQSTGRVALGELSVKALSNAGQGQEGDAGYDVQAQRAEGLYGVAPRRLSLLDALPTLKVESSTFEFMSADGYTNSADYQLKEGDEKARATIAPKVERAEIATIAHWIRASVQVLDDAPTLAVQVGNLLRYGLLQRLEAELIAGAGGEGQIKGLLEYATPFVPSGTIVPADALGAAAMAMASQGWHAGLIVLNPADWFTIASASTPDGQYTLGSPRDPSPLSLWGVPVVITPSLASGTALIIDPQQVAILDRQQPVLMASRLDGENFTRNMITLLAEMRAGLAVFAPDAVLSVDISGS